MVLDDADFANSVGHARAQLRSIPQPEVADWQERLAAPVDRFAAFIADCLFMAPALTLALAPFHREAMRAQLISSRDGWAIAAAMAVGTVALGFIAYHAVFVACMGSTPGKKLFALRVVSIWTNRKPRAGAALARAWGLALEVALGGLPWLAAYSNERRRTLHDRIADTAVVSDKERAASALPTPAEAGAAAGAFAAAMAVVAVIGLVAIDEATRGVREGESEARELEDRGLLCAASADLRAEWPLESRPSRLEAALALEAAGKGDAGCLLKESQREAWSNPQGRALAYAAGAIARKGEVSAFNYAEKACEGDAKAAPCLIARLATTTINDRSSLVADLEQLAEKTNNIYLQTTILREALEQRQWQKALAFAERATPRSGLAGFYAAVRAKALWALGREAEARAAWGATLPILRGTERREMALRACSVQIVNRCSENARFACAEFAALARADGNILKDPDAAVAYLHDQECTSDQRDLASIKKIFVIGQSRSYTELILGVQHNASAADRIHSLRAFLDSASTQAAGENAIWFDAHTRLVGLTASLDDLDSIRIEWEKYAASDATLVLGRALVSRFIELGAPHRALQTALVLHEQDAQTAEGIRAVVAAAFAAGEMRLAASSLATLTDLVEGANGSVESSAHVRAPASLHMENDFARAEHALRTRTARAHKVAP